MKDQIYLQLKWKVTKDGIGDDSDDDEDDDNVLLLSGEKGYNMLGDKGNALEAKGNALRTVDNGVRTWHKDVPVEGCTTVRRARVRATEYYLQYLWRQSYVNARKAR